MSLQLSMAPWSIGGDGAPSAGRSTPVVVDLEDVEIEGSTTAGSADDSTIDDRVRLPALAEEARATGGGEPRTSAPTAASSGVSLGPFELSGFIDQTYRYRESGSDSDQDVYGYYGLDAVYRDTAERDLPFRELGLHLQTSWDLDIDSFASGSGGQSAFLPFFDPSNTFGDRFHAFLHAAYLELDGLGALDRVRLGRQRIHREEGYLFDGGYLRTERWNTLAFEVFGGLPTHLYESSARGDGIGGVGIESEPFRGLVIGANYIYERDAREAALDSEDHVYLLHGRWAWNEEWSARTSASWEGSRDRRQLLELRYLARESGLSVQLRGIRQNGIVEFHSDELSPYLLVEGAYAPYYQYQLDLYRPAGDIFGLGGGVHLRQLEDSSDAGLFNHEFRNYYAMVDARELWPKGTISVRGDVWDADGEDIYTGGVEIDQRIADILRVRVGTSYSLYRFDPFTGVERNRDRVYYARFRWRLASFLDLDTDYQYERDSVTEFHRVTVSMRAQF